MPRMKNPRVGKAERTSPRLTWGRSLLLLSPELPPRSLQTGASACEWQGFEPVAVDIPIASQPVGHPLEEDSGDTLQEYASR